MTNSVKSFDSAHTNAINLRDIKAVSRSLMNRGAAYYSNQQFSNALNDYLEAEKIFNRLKSQEVGGLIGNIALLYQSIGDLKSAKIYLLKSLPYLNKSKDIEGLAKFYNNLGLIYKKEENNVSADSVFKIGLEVARKNSLERDISDLLYNRLMVLINLGRNEEANECGEELLLSHRRNGDKSWLKMITLDVAKVKLLLNQTKEAKKLLKESEEIIWSNETENADSKADYYEGLGEAHLVLKNYQKSAQAFNLMIEAQGLSDRKEEVANTHQLKFNSEKQKDSIAFAKQQEIDHLLNEKEKQEAQHKLSQQRIIIGVSIVGLIVIGLFSGSLLKANRSKEKANAELTEQKKIVSEKNKEITDSITYSKQIQQSLLPTESAFKQYFNQYFLIYKPKDIISGDFYWLKENIKKEIFIAVADCTGHGVPGAIMSALSIQQLNNISRIVTEPGEVLQELNKKIKQNLNQDEIGFSKDGLDISLCKINVAEKRLYYSGANRSLLIYNKAGLKKEIKATKAGIGGHTSNEQVYLEHEIIMESGDYFVMSTDGFADQFGGDKQKKITTKHFKQWLAETGNADFSHKGEELIERFVKWKNNVEQIDDVCVLGFKFD